LNFIDLGKMMKMVLTIRHFTPSPTVETVDFEKKMEET